MYKKFEFHFFLSYYIFFTHTFLYCIYIKKMFLTLFITKNKNILI